MNDRHSVRVSTSKPMSYDSSLLIATCRHAALEQRSAGDIGLSIRSCSLSEFHRDVLLEVPRYSYTLVDEVAPRDPQNQISRAVPGRSSRPLTAAATLKLWHWPKNANSLAPACLNIKRGAFQQREAFQHERGPGRPHRGIRPACRLVTASIGGAMNLEQSNEENSLRNAL
jgi:hypothetical protein